MEAGERLGFLPGTLYEKIDPYLRPLYDALHDMLDPDSIPRLMAAGTIEIAPLAYMRGHYQPVETPVLTPEGFRPIGLLAIGNLVIGSNGEPTPCSACTPEERTSTASPLRTVPRRWPRMTICGPWPPATIAVAANRSGSCPPAR